MTRTYAITGSASGIGASAAAMLTEAGHRVIGIDLKDADVIADLSRPDERLRAAREVTELVEGTLDAVIACAGISAGIPATVSINYFGVTELLTALLPALERSESPRAAVVSSMASLQPSPPELVDAMLAGDEELSLDLARAITSDPNSQLHYLVYPASKRALSRWVRRSSIQTDWAGRGIPLNAVAPGTVLTPMTEPLLATKEGRAMVDAAVPMPLNGHQSPESVASLLLWLTSEENTHLAGQVIYDDGGADVSLRGEDVWSWADPQA